MAKKDGEDDNPQVDKQKDPLIDKPVDDLANTEEARKKREQRKKAQEERAKDDDNPPITLFDDEQPLVPKKEEPQPLAPKKEEPKVEPQNLAQDSFGFESTKTGPEIDPITQAIRDQVIAKQMQLFQDKMAELDPDDKHKIKEMDSAKFRDFLAGKEGKQLFDASLGDKEFGKKLNAVEVEGYKNVHQQFQTSFKNVAWDGPVTENVRTQKITGAEGQDLGTLKETTIPQKPPLTVKLEDGTSKTIDSYRKIDFPTKLDGPKLDSGPLHLSMAVKDEKGNNIAADKAVYFTAHYDKGGNLTEVSTPQPVKFMGEGKDAIGYIERDGQVFTLPVDRGRYETMMKEVAQNKGMGMNVSQTKPVEVAPDLVQVPKIEDKPKEIEGPTRERSKKIDLSVFKKEHDVEAFKKADDEGKVKLINAIKDQPTMPPMHKKAMLDEIQKEVGDGSKVKPTVKWALEDAQKDVGTKIVESKVKSMQTGFESPSGIKQPELSPQELAQNFKEKHSAQAFTEADVETKLKLMNEVANTKFLDKEAKQKLLGEYKKDVKDNPKEHSDIDKGRLQNGVERSTSKVAQEQVRSKGQ